MLYDEFLKGTNARQTAQTYEQYETIERIYSACEDMTKEDAYKLWRQTYGKQARLDRERLLERVQAMSEYRDTDSPTQEQESVRRRLVQAVASVSETNELRGRWGGELTTPDGLTYQLKNYAMINGHRQGDYCSYTKARGTGRRRYTVAEA